jgi:outer membrane biosynthesis protein TonB
MKLIMENWRGFEKTINEAHEGRFRRSPLADWPSREGPPSPSPSKVGDFSKEEILAQAVVNNEFGMCTSIECIREKVKELYWDGDLRPAGPFIISQLAKMHGLSQEEERYLEILWEDPDSTIEAPLTPTSMDAELESLKAKVDDLSIKWNPPAEQQVSLDDEWFKDEDADEPEEEEVIELVDELGPEEDFALERHGLEPLKEPERPESTLVDYNPWGDDQGETLFDVPSFDLPPEDKKETPKKEDKKETPKKEDKKETPKKKETKKKEDKKETPKKKETKKKKKAPKKKETKKKKKAPPQSSFDFGEKKADSFNPVPLLDDIATLLQNSHIGRDEAIEMEDVIHGWNDTDANENKKAEVLKKILTKKVEIEMEKAQGEKK